VRLGELGEFGLIARLAALPGAAAAPAAGRVVLGIGDDAAVLGLPAGRQLVATADGLVEAVHFRRDWTAPEDLGWKALAVNASDLGAMGAAPLAALVTLALPPAVAVEWVEALYRGLGEAAAAFGCPVVGGDTVRSPGPVMVSVTALGSVPRGKAVTRAGARVGDLLCVTGTLGESAAGLELLRAGRTPASDPALAPLFAAHRRPEPPVAAARALAESGAVTAMLDLSDGLASDLAQLAARSGVGVRVAEARLPISRRARQAAAALGAAAGEWAIRGGEDYQYLFTVAPGRFEQVPPLLASLGTVATVIGEVTERGMTRVSPDGAETALPSPGFAHFGREK
jgi:thiamine-monophosphate kinase